MEDNKALSVRCKEGWDRNKKKILIVGGVVIGLAGGYYILQHRKDLAEQICRMFEKQDAQVAVSRAVEKASDTVNEPISYANAAREVVVSPHKMNLPKGKVASEAAKAFAAECNFELEEGQTARHGHTRFLAA